jgi:predicted RNA-binding protein with PIN domain
MQSSPSTGFTAKDLNSEIQAMDSEVKQSYKDITNAKSKLNRIIRCYEHLLKETSRSQLEEAIRGEIASL